MPFEILEVYARPDFPEKLREHVVLSLVADVATAWYELLELDLFQLKGFSADDALTREAGRATRHFAHRIQRVGDHNEDGLGGVLDDLDDLAGQQIADAYGPR